MIQGVNSGVFGIDGQFEGRGKLHSYGDSLIFQHSPWLEGNQSTVKAIYSLRDGTPQNCPLSNQNNSRVYDGISYLNFGAEPFHDSGSFTVSSWIKLKPGTLLSTADHIYGIISKSELPGSPFLQKGWGLNLRSSSLYNGLFLRFYNNLDLTPSFDVSPIIRDNQWHQVVAIIDYKSGKGFLYLDGQLVGTNSGYIDSGIGIGQNLLIGSWHYTNGTFNFPGNIGLTSFYSSAINEAVLMQVYQREKSLYI